ncbi:MAG: hypothetical protein F6K31_22835 [Symploca sp. SIO2G7]|nr:hypothetical protein [Symploca sp. SIO2G7]
MSEADNETIWIITVETPQVEEENGSRSGGSWRKPSTKNPVTKATKVSVQKVEAELSKFLQVIGGLLSRAQRQVPPESGLRLDEIELSVEVNGEGEVKFLGTGGKVGSKGGITLKFKRTGS